MAGLAFWVPWFPIDVIKSGVMGDSYVRSRRRYTGFIDAAVKVRLAPYAVSSTVPCFTLLQIYQAGGVPAFYRGFTPCVMRAFVASAANLFTVFQLQNIGFPFGWGCE